jgi:hypothetical protein
VLADKSEPCEIIFKHGKVARRSSGGVLRVGGVLQQSRGDFALPVVEGAFGDADL